MEVLGICRRPLRRFQQPKQSEKGPRWVKDKAVFWCKNCNTDFSVVVRKVKLSVHSHTTIGQNFRREIASDLHLRTDYLNLGINSITAGIAAIFFAVTAAIISARSSSSDT